ncbi:MAG: ribbon-helix-helix protein, CopG family [Candidatus Woesearchaeota archaeon]
MKQVLTISLEEETARRVREFTRTSKFKNKSHVVEAAIKQFLEVEDDT